MEIQIDLNSIDSYQTFLKVKSLPSYRFIGRTAIVPDEYAAMLDCDIQTEASLPYVPMGRAYDFQRAIAATAIEKRKFSIFADCGLGKTIMLMEFAKHAVQDNNRVLIVSPKMVIPQTLDEADKFYGDNIAIEHVQAARIQQWLRQAGPSIGITSYNAMVDELEPGQLGSLILDESSMLKSHYGKWGQVILRLGRGLKWKLACTGTPAPNDRIEYANHAVFMDAFPNVNAFLARFFVNRGQTQERWALKPHALKPFYRSLAHWSIFLNNPASYGWKDIDTSTLPPIHVHKHHVDMTEEQTKLTMATTGALFAHRIGGIANRASLASIAKGWYKGEDVETLKPQAIKALVDSWPNESTIIWCLYNREQEILDGVFPDAVSITGTTPDDVRQRGIDDFKAGRNRILISKPKILGFGLNLQIATRQIFSGLQDSYESYYQAVKRSNRIGSTRPLHVHIPITDIEEPMVQNVLRKAALVQSDCLEQERIFRECHML